MNAVISFILNNYPTIGMMIIVALVVFWATKYHLSIQNTKKKVDLLPCDSNGKKLDILELQIGRLPCDSHTAKLDRHSTKLDIIDFKIDTISASLEHLASKKDAYSKRKSPLSLSNLGVELASSNNFKEIINKNWNKINASIKALGTNNPYDLQKYSIDTALADVIVKPPTFFTEEDIDKFKILAYKSDADLLSVTRVLGIMIRDRYFEENNIDVFAVDSHDPALNYNKENHFEDQ